MIHPVQSMDGVLYDRDPRHEIVKNCEKLKWRQREFPASSFRFILLKLCEYIPKSLCFTFLLRIDQISVDTKPMANKIGLETTCIWKV